MTRTACGQRTRKIVRAYTQAKLKLAEDCQMKKQVAIIFLMCLVVLISSCSYLSAPTKEPVVVTGDSAGAPIGCSPEEIAQRIEEAFDAINRADPDVVDEYFGRADFAPFGWYTIGNNEEFFSAYQWRTLDEYLGQRFQQHEHLELRSIRFNSWDEERGLVHFGPIEVARWADDLGETERNYSGKGAYYCETRTIVVLSLGEEVVSP